MVVDEDGGVSPAFSAGAQGGAGNAGGALD